MGVSLTRKLGARARTRYTSRRRCHLTARRTRGGSMPPTGLDPGRETDSPPTHTTARPYTCTYHTPRALYTVRPYKFAGRSHTTPPPQRRGTPPHHVSRPRTFARTVPSVFARSPLPRRCRKRRRRASGVRHGWASKISELGRQHRAQLLPSSPCLEEGLKLVLLQSRERGRHPKKQADAHGDAREGRTPCHDWRPRLWNLQIWQLHP